MKRRDFLKQLGLGATAVAAGSWLEGAAAQAATWEKPNIVFIMADDLGYGHLGCYGQEHIKTPHIDKLAQEGMKFTQAYAGCSLCAPSRSVLMTGYHCGHTPVRGNSGGIALEDADKTVAEVLQEAGYKTGLFGKWGLGDAQTTGVPNKQGFDEFFGYLHQKHAHFYYTDYLWQNDKKYPLEANKDYQRNTYSHDVICDKALDFMRDNQENSFFLFLSLTIPHHEWTAPEASVKEYSGKFEENPPEFRWRNGYAHPKEPKANMAGMISHMDRSVGQVDALLEELGLSKNTLLIFTSDNGADRYSIACPEFFKANAPLRDFKGTLYEGGLRIPMVARWPEKIAAGTVTDHMCYFGDFMPTFAEMAGNSAGVPKDVDAISMLPALTGGAQEEHDFLYWATGTGEQGRACRVGKWKAVWPAREAAVELYDLDTDIAEANNIADQHPKIARQMKKLMEREHETARPQIEPHAPDGRYYV